MRRPRPLTLATRMGRFSNPRKLAVVPAYNEADVGRDVVRKLQTHAPELRRPRRRRRLHRRHGAHRRGRRRARAAAPVQPRHRRRRAGGFRYALDNGYDYVVQVDGDGQHDPREIRRLEEAMRRERVDMVCGSRFLTKDHKYPAPISRRTGIHLFAFLLSRFVGQRVSDPTSGFRLYNRRGDLGVRARLPARLSRGRGGADGALAPAPDVRGARADAHAQRRRVVDQRLRQVGLLHGQGAAGDLRRAWRAGDTPSSPATRRPSRRPTGSDGHAAPDRRHHRRRRAAGRAARAGAPAAAARALRAALALQRGRPARPVRLGADCSRGRERDRRRLSAERALPHRLRLRDGAAAALLARGLAAVGPDEGARAAAGAAGGAAPPARGGRGRAGSATNGRSSSTKLEQACDRD